jgi:hypothetical protein
MHGEITRTKRGKSASALMTHPLLLLYPFHDLGWHVYKGRNMPEIAVSQIQSLTRALQNPKLSFGSDPELLLPGQLREDDKITLHQDHHT